ncbi:MAG: hypothetical protein JXB15_04600 [Anaerolineales bacterium]|nr:hypothetical protein [Anaerolineales bacterium]
MSRRNREQILQASLELLASPHQDLEEVLNCFPEQAEWLRPQLEAAAWLQQRRPTLEPRPAWAAAARGRALIGLGPHKFAWRAFTRRLVYGALALFMAFYLLLSGSRLAHASQAWLPGDGLYPFKMALERAELLISLDAAGDARLHVEFARLRLMEMQALTFEARYEQLSPTVNAFEQHIRQAAGMINRLGERDPRQARQLALDLQQTLTTETDFMFFLAELSPQPVWQEFQRVEMISRQSLSTLQEYLPQGQPNGS